MPSEHIDPDELQPGIRAGFTEGIPQEEALALFPDAPTATETVRHMRDEGTVGDSRVPIPRFVAESDTGAVWTDGVTDRVQQDVAATFQKETVLAFQAGMICLRCYEPQAHAFPGECDLCGYAMQERQIVDFTMEFEGGKHLGPSKPITEYMEEQNIRVEKREFARKIAGGKSPMKGLR